MKRDLAWNVRTGVALPLLFEQPNGKRIRVNPIHLVYIETETEQQYEWTRHSSTGESLGVLALASLTPLQNSLLNLGLPTA